MKKLVETIVQGLVNKPEEIQIKEVEGERTDIVELNVAQEDLGKVIGKQGRTARAIRTLISAGGKKMKKKAALEILE